MLLSVVVPGQADRHVALVIGNNRYASLPASEQLQKAANDARSVGGALQQIGFEVILGENLDRRALGGKLNEFVQRLTPGDTAFFFFSGHGVALEGVNYILPAGVQDIAAGQETSLKAEALSEQYIVSEITGRGVRVAVVVLHACRTNPFSRPGGKGIGVTKACRLRRRSRACSRSKRRAAARRRSTGFMTAIPIRTPFSRGCWRRR
jgi:uncharacterized caspase-like protein